MMRAIVSWSLRARLLVVGLATALMVFGVFQLRSMEADTLPEYSPTSVEIRVEALGLSANEVEQLITAPLEADLLNGIKGVSTFRSESVAGLSSMVLVFESGTDVLAARQYTQEKLIQAAGLPQLSTPPHVIEPLSSQSRVMMIGLSSRNLSEIDQGVLARWTIKPRLLGVPGVANVAIWGQRDRQLQVQVDPKRLQEQNVSLIQVIKTAGNAQLVSPLTFLESSTPGTGGLFDTPNQRLGVRHVFPIVTPADLAKVQIEETGGRNLRLGDVARVVEGHQQLIGDALVNDRPGMFMVVEKTPGANTKDVTRGVEKALDDLRPGLSGLEMHTSVFRPARFVDEAISNLTVALLVGFALMAMALAALMFDWRIGVISFAAIAVSLVAAALVLDLFGTTMNAMVFAGLALAAAVVVHDGVIDADSIRERLRQRGDDEGSAAALVLEGSMDVRRAALYAMLIVLLSVVPVFLMEGVSGSVLRPLALSYALAVVAAMVVALTLTPALSLLLFSKAPAQRRQSPVIGWLRPRYEAALNRVTSAPRTLYVAMAVFVLLGAAVMPTLEQPSLPALLPPFKERDLMIHWNARAGTSEPEMSRVTARVGRELRGLPGVQNVGGHLGRAVSGDQVGGVSRGDVWVSVDENADYDSTVAAVKEVVNGYPGLDHEVTTYSRERAKAIGAMEDGRDDERSYKDDDVLKATRSDLAVRVYGQNQEILQRQAESVNRMVSGVDGVAGSSVEKTAFEPTIELKTDLDAAERNGLKPGEVRREATSLLSGITVGNLFERQKVFDVVVWTPKEDRSSVSDVNRLLIDTPGGGHVRLGDVADVRIRPSPTVIRHESTSRYVDVGVNVDGRDRDAVASDIRDRLHQASFPLEYHAEVIGESAEHSVAFKRVLSIAIAAAIAIFLLLQAMLGSWRLAIVLFLTLPVALTGGLLALFLDGGVISIGAAFGFLAVLAIAARNGILLLRRYQALEAGGGGAPPPDRVALGTGERLAPIITGAVATMMILLPLVVAGSVAGLEILHPMAVVIVGGLITSTLVSLLALPAAYLRFGPGSGPGHDSSGSRSPDELATGSIQ